MLDRVGSLSAKLDVQEAKANASVVLAYEHLMALM
jgi:hypothetical protein